MEDYSHLTIIAELAVAFAGFAGVFVVLRHEAKGDWTRLERVRLASLLTLSIPVVFFSLIPVGQAPLIAQSEEVWRVSVSFSGLVLLALGAWAFPTYTRATNRIPSIASQNLTTIVAKIMALLFVVALALYAAVGLRLTSHQFSCYYFALLVQLLMCSIVFGRILLVRPPRESQLPGEHKDGRVL